MLVPLFVGFLSIEVVLASGCLPEDDLSRYSGGPSVSSAAGGAAGDSPDGAVRDTAGASGSGGAGSGGALGGAANGGALVDAGDASAPEPDAGVLGASDSGLPLSSDPSGALADAAP
jgi:hypothetical protein